jgi:hypothetical protein
LMCKDVPKRWEWRYITTGPNWKNLEQKCSQIIHMSKAMCGYTKVFDLTFFYRLMWVSGLTCTHLD